MVTHKGWDLISTGNSLNMIMMGSNGSNVKLKDLKTKEICVELQGSINVRINTG